MKPVCGRSWGSTERGWIWCTNERGHEGNCHNWARGDKPADERFFDEQPEATAFLEKQREAQAKIDAKKGGGTT